MLGAVMRELGKIYIVLEHLFGGDMFLGTFKTVVWLIAAAVIAGLLHPYASS